MLNLAAIVGPTAVGKTSLALKWHEIWGGRSSPAIPCKFTAVWDIGTAKATSDERAVVPHHLLDIVEVGDDFSVADYSD
jgi:tRNA dimethylallyltransferase